MLVSSNISDLTCLEPIYFEDRPQLVDMVKNPEGQLAQWVEALQEYNFTIAHRKGRLHGAMSRKPCTQCGRDSHIITEEVTLALMKEQNTAIPARSNEDIQKLQVEDPSIGFVLCAKEADECPSSDILKGQSLQVQRLMQLWPRLLVVDGILWRQYEDLETKQEWRQLVVPQSLQEVMEELHAGMMGGYIGESKTLQQLKHRFYWPGNSLDVKRWCQTCSICASRKTTTPKNCAPQQTIKAGSPMQVIALLIILAYTVQLTIARSI